MAMVPITLTCFNHITFFEQFRNQLVVNRSATLIDHIWTNGMQDYIIALYTSISDDFPVLSLFIIDVQYGTSYITITGRQYNKDNITFKEGSDNNRWD